MSKTLQKENGTIPVQQGKRKRHQELISVALEKHFAALELGRLTKEILTIDNQPSILSLPNGRVPSIPVYARLEEPNRLFLAVLATLHHFEIADVTVTYRAEHNTPSPHNEEPVQTIPITITKALYHEWLCDLQSGIAPQGQFSMFDGTGHCCLGRLCTVAGRQTPIDEDDYADNQGLVCSPTSRIRGVHQS